MHKGIVSILFLYFFIFSCTSKKISETFNAKPSGLSGEELAKIHCASCHVFPEADLLPKEIWLKGVLPKMALRLGQGDFMQEMMSHQNTEMMVIMESGIYPDKPLIVKEDWEKIVKYYEDNAPENLKSTPTHITTDLDLFAASPQKINAQEIVMTKFDSLSKKIFVGSALKSSIYSFQMGSKKIDSVKTKSPNVDFGFHNNLGRVELEVGILNPSDLSEGRLLASGKVLKDKMHRPVNLVLADVNEDGTEDFIVSNFGNLLGSLVWYDGKTFEENLLLNEPGARVVYFVDFDKDGKKDILALMTQGRESIVFFKNIGKGAFEMKPLLRFPPVYGSSYFVVKDLNNDGYLDFVYTNGDNADLSIVKKPYHGLRIFINDGKMNFSEKYFYPINGASKVLVEDFDQDGDFDMAIISFFPDDKKKEGFLYFEQTKNFNFNIKSKKNISNEKWLTMDKGDFDGDGDIDLVLGAFNRDRKTPSKINSVVILENKLNPKTSKNK
ncbi:VCBS repeat-containing protein [Lacihabitans sp. LS3-19]|uniref:FG-GAP repeat domain-containing protein n=1 Tax=Lacihabitans sp. LS3-19 TaxID=2487335 RepID=UPI0020CE9B3D|nr:VCBS repeat-containing protein [Lacihabitans sp. LS3-19]MCP9770092.1 VCBS repeat-containing protein [Lacihabitans sp. LS3-19]